MKKKKTVPMVNTNVVIPVDQRRKLREVAQETNTDLSKVIRTANDMFLEHYKSMKKLRR